MKIISLLDGDSFECAIYQNKYPQWKNKPCVVADKSGRILSVTYEAKQLGVTRNNRVKNLQRFWNFEGEIKVFVKPQKNNKPDSSDCRFFSHKITQTVIEFCRKRNITIERVPTDEWFLDLTEFVDSLIEKQGWRCIPRLKGHSVRLESKVSYTQERLTERMDWLRDNYKEFVEEEKLMIAASAMNKLMKEIYNLNGFSCSAGVSYNKLLAKQACKLHKPQPNRLTIISSLALKRIGSLIDVRDIWGLGGVLGDKVEARLPSVKTMADLKKIRKRKLVRLFGVEYANLLYERARGICHEKVIPKVKPATVNSSKTNLKIKSYKELRRHLDDLSKDMIIRLEEDQSWHQRYTEKLKIQFVYRESDDEDSEERPVERTFDYDRKDWSWIAQTCFLEIRKWGFHPYKRNDHTVITEFKLTAKNFIDC